MDAMTANNQTNEQPTAFELTMELNKKMKDAMQEGDFATLNEHYEKQMKLKMHQISKHFEKQLQLQKEDFEERLAQNQRASQAMDNKFERKFAVLTKSAAITQQKIRHLPNKVCPSYGTECKFLGNDACFHFQDLSNKVCPMYGSECKFLLTNECYHSAYVKSS